MYDINYVISNMIHAKLISDIINKNAETPDTVTAGNKGHGY